MRTIVLLVVLALVLAVMAEGEPTTRPAEFSELHRVALADASDLQVVMGLIERSGESVSGKHIHPGGEFGFVIQGSVTVATEREPHATLNAGDSFYQPPGEWHVVGTAAEGARTVVFRVVKKGNPMVVAVE